MILSIVSITPLIATSAILPCLIATIKVFSKFGALKERSYHEIIWLQILKTLREKKNAVRELRQCDKRAITYMTSESCLHASRFWIFPAKLSKKLP
jgi:hypothetical protein